MQTNPYAPPDAPIAEPPKEQWAKNARQPATILAVVLVSISYLVFTIFLYFDSPGGLACGIFSTNIPVLGFWLFAAVRGSRLNWVWGVVAACGQAVIGTAIYKFLPHADLEPVVFINGVIAIVFLVVSGIGFANRSTSIANA